MCASFLPQKFLTIIQYVPTVHYNNSALSSMLIGQYSTLSALVIFP